MRFIYIGAVYVAVIKKNASNTVLSLVPWAMQQQLVCIIFVLVSSKKPRHVQLKLLVKVNTDECIFFKYLKVSELLKLGSHSFEDLKQFTVSIEEKLFRMDALRDRSLTYKTEEIQVILAKGLLNHASLKLY